MRDRLAEALGAGSFRTARTILSPAFVARFLEHEDEAIVEAAALALGESRIPAAFEFLRQAWDAVLASADLERAFLRAAAFHRSEAFEQHCLEA